jgi:hypothetical protein
MITALDGGEWPASEPDHFNPGTHWIRGWMGPRAGLESVKKILLPLIEVETRFLIRPASSLANIQHESFTMWYLTYHDTNSIRTRYIRKVLRYGAYYVIVRQEKLIHVHGAWLGCLRL